MSKSNLTQYLSEVRVKRKYVPTHETAPLFLYKHIKIATYSFDWSNVLETRNRLMLKTKTYKNVPSSLKLLSAVEYSVY